MKVLLVDDEDALRKPVKRFLINNKVQVEEADNGKDGLKLAQMNAYDCILLDLNLPEIDGIEVCRKLRELEILTPIIMLTARSQVSNKLEGFDIGADDYITKPFNLMELLARIKAVVKRNSSNKNSKLIIGDWEIVVESNLARSNKSKIEIQLSNKEVGILEYLLRNKGRIISTEELLEHVWDSNVDLFTETVKTHMKTLRKKLDPNKKLIKTVKGKGYVV